MSYISPIKIEKIQQMEEGWADKISKYIAGEVDNLVLESCVKVGCHVDKDELEKALRYDRDQYSKGYADGKRDAAAAIEELQAEVDALKRTDIKRCQECLYLGQPVGEQQLPKRGKWVRVEDELPNDGDWAIFTNGKVVSVERFKVDAYNHFFPASQWFDFEDAIAWMPLPKPPKEDA